MQEETTSHQTFSDDEEKRNENVKKSADAEPGNFPVPLPYPPYLPRIINAEKANTILLVRSQLIRESARFYLGLKYDLSRDYDIICQHLLKRFAELQDAIILPGATCTYVSSHFFGKNSIEVSVLLRTNLKIQ